MKATINGIIVEGTPQEIADYQKVMEKMRREGVHIKPPLGSPPPWVIREQDWYPYMPVTPLMPKVTSATDSLQGSLGVTIKPEKCWAASNGGCNCTGACMK